MTGYLNKADMVDYLMFAGPVRPASERAVAAWRSRMMRLTVARLWRDLETATAPDWPLPWGPGAFAADGPADAIILCSAPPTGRGPQRDKR